MHIKVLRITVSLFLLLAAFPVTQLAIQNGFGLPATMIVPTIVLGLWFCVSSRYRTDRIGWFALASVSALWLPTGPWWNYNIESLLNRIQAVVSHTLYQSVEAIGVFAIYLVPWGVACLSGKLVATLARRSLKFHRRVDPPHHENEAAFQFTLKEMLFAFAICGMLTAWLSGSVRQWHTRETSSQKRFLALFKESFTSGNVVLLGPPEITERQQGIGIFRIKSSKINEYRVVAPVRRGGEDQWAVWTYCCDSSGAVGKFGYADAAARAGLPTQPIPRMKYLWDSSGRMIDGEPENGWPKPQIMRAVPKMIRVGDTITIVAKATAGSQCELIVHPFQAVIVPPPMQIAPAWEPVIWHWKLDPQFKGKKVEFEVRSQMQSNYRASSVMGSIDIERDKAE